MKFTIKNERDGQVFQIKGKKDLFQWILYLVNGSGFDVVQCSKRSTIKEMLDCFKHYAGYTYTIERG